MTPYQRDTLITWVIFLVLLGIGMAGTIALVSAVERHHVFGEDEDPEPY